MLKRAAEQEAPQRAYRGPAIPTALVLAFSISVAALMLTAAEAGAPPVPGELSVSIRGPDCARYGTTLEIGGGGFGPRSTIRIESFEGSYTGPIPGPIEAETVRADSSGDFDAVLRIAPRLGSNPYAWVPRTIFATEQSSGGGEGTTQSFDQVVIGTRRVCGFLNRSERGGAAR